MADSFKASARGLEIIDQARRRKGWKKTVTVTWWQSANTSQATLKRFWRRQPIEYSAFIGICQAVGVDNWEEIVERGEIELPHLQPFTLPEKIAPVRNWVGRKDELNTLKSQILAPQAQGITAICLVGLAGAGKTTLASQLIRQLHLEKAPFVVAAWESLASATGKPPQFDGIIDSLLFTLSQGEITTDITCRDDSQQKTERLIKLLKEQPSLVVLDNVETVLKTKQAKGAGYFSDDHTEYTWLFKQLTETEHQSKVICTSRETLAQLSRPTTLIIPITGLDTQAAVNLLKPFALTANLEELAQLAQRYQGHPKALEIVSAVIHEEFQGQVGRFLQERQWLLIRDIESLIEEVINRLSDQEYTCLSRVAVYQTSEYPLLYEAIAAQMPQVVERDLKENIILALKRRYLLEYEPVRECYFIHPLIQEKTSELLDGKSRLQAYRQAYEYFLHIPLKQQSEWEDLEDIKPLLLAYEYACQAGDWNQAAAAISEVYEYLYEWGYFDRIIKFYQNLISSQGKDSKQLVSSTHEHSEILYRLGVAYHSLGRFEFAHEYLQNALKISRQINYVQIETKALSYLGINYQYQGNFSLADEYLSECLKLTPEKGDEYKNIKFRALYYLAKNNYYSQNYQKSTDLYKQAIALACQFNLIEDEIVALSDLGNIYIEMEVEQSAIFYIKECLQKIKQLKLNKCRSVKVYVLMTKLAEIYIKLADYQNAIQYAQEVLKILGNYTDEYYQLCVLNILGIAHRELKEYNQSLDYFNQALEIAAEIVAPDQEGDILYNLGIAYRERGQLKESFNILQNSLRFFHQIGDRDRESKVLLELEKTGWQN
ncbi:MAG: tetratricopeptide repeat protein [Symploca sp. SIO2B6]|nr:tetratricopeptide repeat protein [Symploca sp. SIO2B6]